MDVGTRFAKVLAADRVQDADPDLLPERLTRAAAAVLPVDGVGLSVHGTADLRTPLAASSHMAATAEALQFTAGRGPCMLSAESRLPVFATEKLLAQRWPVFHELLVTRTPLRGVLALSLPGRLRGIGDMDLYFTDPDGPAAIDVDDARCVAELVSAQLAPAADWSIWTQATVPDWPNTPDARRRGRLWMAVGMVIFALRMPPADALALLRGSAYATDRTVDELAADLIERRLGPGELREDQHR
jgi:hypothetical protein